MGPGLGLLHVAGKAFRNIRTYLLCVCVCEYLLCSFTCPKASNKYTGASTGECFCRIYFAHLSPFGHNISTRVPSVCPSFLCHCHCHCLFLHPTTQGKVSVRSFVCSFVPYSWAGPLVCQLFVVQSHHTFQLPPPPPQPPSTPQTMQIDAQ